MYIIIILSSTRAERNRVYSQNDGGILNNGITSSAVVLYILCIYMFVRNADSDLG